MLVNDLDLKVIDPSSDDKLPWILDVANYAAPATRGNNHVDNVEQVFLETPEEGIYIIEITHKGDLKYGEQDYSLITSGCTVVDKEIRDLPITLGSNHLLLNERPTVQNGADFGFFQKDSGSYMKSLKITNTGSSGVVLSNIKVTNSPAVSVVHFPETLSAGEVSEINLVIDTNLIDDKEEFQLVVEIGEESYSFQLKCHVGEETFPHSTWTSAWSGQTDWLVDTDIHSNNSHQSFRSKTIDNNEEVVLTFDGDVEEGEVSFYFKVSSERGYDSFTFEIDGAKQDLLSNSTYLLSGEVGWSKFSTTVSNGSGSGHHTFIWRYKKDNLVLSGHDAVWIDELVIPKEKSDHVISFQAEAGGNVSGDLVQAVEDGGGCREILATPIPGCTFAGWYDNQDTSIISFDNPLVISHVTESTTYTASFTKDNPFEEIGLIFNQDGRTVSWTVEGESDLDEYQLYNVETGNLIVIIQAGGDQPYVVDLDSDIDVRLEVITLNGESRSYYPPFDYNDVIETYSLNAGWNLIAMVGDDSDLTNIREISRGHFWGWDNEKGVYIPVTAPLACEGVWVYNNSGDDKDIEVKSRKSSQTISLAGGWNLVGPINAQFLPSVSDSGFFWDSVEYKKIDHNATMFRGKGYWLFIATEQSD
jgi:hypothetical protein